MTLKPQRLVRSRRFAGDFTEDARRMGHDAHAMDAIDHAEGIRTNGRGQVIFVGVDPGLHGAVAWLDGERKQIHVDDCPLDGTEYDFRRMAELVRNTFGWSRDLEAHHVPPVVVMEAVHALPTDGKCSAFSFGRGYGAWLGIFGALGLIPILVAPQTWKRTMLAGIANDKQSEATALKQRFQGHEICSQLHGPRGGLRDGRVDALLLAEYGRLTWKISRSQVPRVVPVAPAVQVVELRCVHRKEG